MNLGEHNTAYKMSNLFSLPFIPAPVTRYGSILGLYSTKAYTHFFIVSVWSLAKTYLRLL